MKNHAWLEGIAFQATQTKQELLPLWNQSIAPAVKAAKRVIITAHGNSIRALIKYLDNISDEEITDLGIPNGVPIVYTLNHDLQPTFSTTLSHDAGRL